MSRFNLLYRGEPENVIVELEDREATEEELRAALINAMQRIQTLEAWVAELRGDNAR